MKKCHLWVKIFLKHIQFGEYSLMEQKITKKKVIGVVLVTESGQHYPTEAKL